MKRYTVASEAAALLHVTLSYANSADKLAWGQPPTTDSPPRPLEAVARQLARLIAKTSRPDVQDSECAAAAKEGLDVVDGLDRSKLAAAPSVAVQRARGLLATAARILSEKREG